MEALSGVDELRDLGSRDEIGAGIVGGGVLPVEPGSADQSCRDVAGGLERDRLSNREGGCN